MIIAYQLSCTVRVIDVPVLVFLGEFQLECKESKQKEKCAVKMFFFKQSWLSGTPV